MKELENPKKMLMIVPLHARDDPDPLLPHSDLFLVGSIAQKRGQVAAKEGEHR